MSKSEITPLRNQPLQTLAILQVVSVVAVLLVVAALVAVVPAVVVLAAAVAAVAFKRLKWKVELHNSLGIFILEQTNNAL